MTRTRASNVVLTDHPAPESLLARIQGLGLSRNEALAYLTLLGAEEEQGITGYEVGSRSSIPRSAVYTVLRKLQDVGAAFSVGEKPERFVAIAPERWLAQVRQTAELRIAEAQAELQQVRKQQRPEPIWILNGYDEVLSRIDQLIRSAQQSVWLSLWPRELAVLAPALETVAKHRLHRVLHCPSALSEPPAGFACWSAREPEGGAPADWSHKALVVIDGREALIGGTEPYADNHAVYTTNPSLVDTATNHIILDITLLARQRGENIDALVAPMMRTQLSLPTDSTGESAGSAGDHTAQVQRNP